MNYMNKKDWKNVMTKGDDKYFRKARQEEDIADDITNLASNCSKTHPAQKFYNKYRIPSDSMLPKLHAEINCINSIKQLNINFSKVKLYIYRIRKDQPYGLARPCPSCMAAIKDLGIRNIYYTSNDGYVHERIEKCKVGGVV